MATPAAIYPKVDENVFLGVMWAGVAVSFVFMVFRTFVRVHVFRRVYWDDFFVWLAWSCFLGSSIAWQTQHEGLYDLYGLADGTLFPVTDVINAFLGAQKGQLAVLFLFYTCLWSIKVAFLIFFRRLGNQIMGVKVWWWCVMGFIIATFFTCIGTIQYHCLLDDFFDIIIQCTTPDAIAYENTTFHYLMAIDLITDVAVITIPVLLLWNVRISIKQKLGLMGIFSLTIFVMLIAIIRVVLVSNGPQEQDDVTWLYFWTNLEMTVALIVSCLASFRQLFTKPETHQHTPKRQGMWSTIKQSLLGTYLQRSEASHDSMQEYGAYHPSMDRPRFQSYEERGSANSVQQIHVRSDIKQNSDTDTSSDHDYYSHIPRTPVRSPAREPVRSPPREQVRSPPREQVRSPAREPVRSPVYEQIGSPVREPTPSPPRKPVPPPREQVRSPPREQVRSPPREQVRSPPREQVRSPASQHHWAHIRN